MENQLVGILVDPPIYNQIARHKPSRENASFYQEGAKGYHLTPVFFRLRDINLGGKKILGLLRNKKGNRIGLFPIPDVIHNRIIAKNGEQQRKLQSLTLLGKRLFNPINRIHKWKVYQIMERDQEVKSALPVTMLASPNNLRLMMDRFGQLIIKPDNGSIGEGIMLLEREETGWRLDYPVQEAGKTRWYHHTFRRRIPPVLIRRIGQRRYLIQERIPFLKKEGRPFDLRVAVQKEYGGEWTVTGIVAKVARKGHFLTNVARGGTSIPFEEAMKDHPLLPLPQLRSEINRLALQTARRLEKKIPAVADLGLDIGIREDGKPFLIEINLRDLRITFRNAGLLEEWKKTHTTPIAYAAYLMRHRKG